MILAVNIGNTNVRAAIGQTSPEKDIVAFWDEIKTPDALTAFLGTGFGEGFWHKLTGVIVSSVVPGKTQAVVAGIQGKSGLVPGVVNAAELPPMQGSPYTDLPGEDRLVCCFAALLKYPPPLIVVDFGTATTVNVINAGGVFIGGAIFAGPCLSLDALAERTAQLPRIASPLVSPPLIGNNTREGMLSGAVFGEAFTAQGYISRIREELGGSVPAVVTGGNAPVILPHCRVSGLVFERNLLLEGLFALAQKERG